MNIVKFSSRLRFCLAVSRNVFIAYNLLFEQRKFNKIYQYKINPDTKENDAILYKLKLFGKKIDLYLRTQSGDIAMFFEVFYNKVYNVPNQILSSPKTIIDLGANVGCTSVFFALKYPDSKIISLEPSAKNYELLQKNIYSLKNIKTINAAVWTETKKIDFADDTFTFNSKIAQGKNSYEIDALNVEDIFKQENIQSVDLMKIDIEGAEKNIFEQNANWLQKVNNIIIELHHPYSDKNFEEDVKPYEFKVLAPSPKGLKMFFAAKNEI